MLSELPDLDEDVSFVVDDGASTGPVPLRLIVASVMSGQRASNVLVWWAGATDWMRFDSHPDLVALLKPAADQDDDATDSVASEPVMTRWGTSGGDVVFADDAEPEQVAWEPEADMGSAADVAEGSTSGVDEVAAPEPLYVEFVDMDPVESVPDDESAEQVAEASDVVAAEFPDPVVEQFVAAEQFVPIESIEPMEQSEPSEPSELMESTEPADHGQDTGQDALEALSDDSEVVEPAVESLVSETPVDDVPIDAVPVDEALADAPADDALVAEAPVDEAPFDDAPVDEAPVDDAPVVEAPVDEAPEATGDSGEGGAFSFGLPVRETAAPTQDDATAAGLTGLFSSGAREHGGLSPSEPQTPSPDALDAIMAARVSLESVGARIDALTSATRRTSAPEQQQDGASASIEDLDGGLEGLTDDRESVLIASVSSVEAATVDVETAGVESDVSTGGSWRAVEEHVPTEDSSVFEATDTVTAAVVDVPVANEVSTAHKALTERFEEMVRRSESHQRRIEWVMRVDELLLSACITAIADSGFVAMDLTSRESDHRVLFDHNSDSRQVRLELSPVDTVSDHLGRHVRLGLSWGRAVGDIDTAFETVERESVGELIPPGVLTCEADMSSGVVSTHVELILAADDFVKDDYSVDRPSLDTSIAATLHALEEHWHVLFD